MRQNGELFYAESNNVEYNLGLSGLAFFAIFDRLQPIRSFCYEFNFKKTANWPRKYGTRAAKSLFSKNHRDL